MKEYLLVPVIIASLMGVLTDLEDLSHQVSDKTVKFAQDATSALDCAYEARPLTECAPDITSKEFSDEIAQTNAILQELKNA
jgi:hypothetical protein